MGSRICQYAPSLKSLDAKCCQENRILAYTAYNALL
jgi:hypothetical protein